MTDSTGISDPVPDERLITVVSAGSANQAPSAVISAPLLDRTINIGESVYFDALGSDPDGHYPLTYLWDFNGAAPNFVGSTPGNVVFNASGTFRVRLTVVDAMGLSSTNVVERIITVLQVGSGGVNQAPVAAISQPTNNVTIQAGQSVYFTGGAYDPDGNTPLSFRWDFGPLIGTRTTQNPGNIAFNSDGVYPVSLVVRDSKGLDSAAVTRVVTVGGNAVAGNSAPNGQILTPSSDTIIQVNDSLYFTSSYYDADGDSVTYVWDFDGVTYNRQNANPGWITFDQQGVFSIILTVKDSKGAVDPQPAIRKITVLQ